MMCYGLLAAILLGAGPSDYFLIQVVDEQTGRPVPLVELRTVNGIRYYTDSNGIVAFREPGLMNRIVFFHVWSHGYEYPADGFGYRGARLRTKPGTTALLKIKRRQIAQRLYRVTGQGIYNYSLLAGLPTPLRHPDLNGSVMGQDSVVNAVFKGKIYWFWGDTNRPAYPLGNFHVPGATSLLPGQGGLDPEQGVDLEYFLDENGFAKETCRMPGRGPTWINGLTVLRDRSGRERMFAAYAKIKPGSLEAYRRGIVEFDDETKQFREVRSLSADWRARPLGHPLQVEAGGKRWVLFASPFPVVRVEASVEQFLDPKAYEVLTPLRAGQRAPDGELDRLPSGRLRWGWKRGTDPLTSQELLKLVQGGKLRREEVPLQLRDRDTGKPILVNAGSVYWNAYRQRYVAIVEQVFGTSMLGEIWYAEADTPVGPWGYAVKIVTHEKYSFYNPKHHPMFDKDGGRIIYFEGTYSTFLSGAPFPTPRYNYNQIMYKLDLADERLALPVPVYDVSSDRVSNRFQTRLPEQAEDRGSRVAFFAPDRRLPGTVPVVADAGTGRLAVAPDAAADEVIFYVLERPLPGENTLVPLYEYVAKSGQKYRYATTATADWPGFKRAERPIGYVWAKPYRTELLDEVLAEY